MSEEIDHEFTGEVVCPHCGWADRDSWERHMKDGDEQHDECGKCFKPFVVYANVTIEYTTKKCEPKP